MRTPLGGNAVFHPPLASAGLRILGPALVAALIVSCAPEDSRSLAEPELIIPEPDPSTSIDGDVISEAPPLIADEDLPESELPEFLSPISTALPLIGHRVVNSEYFGRSDESILESPDMYSPGEKLSGLNFEQAQDLLDFVPVDYSYAQIGYVVEEIAVFLDERAVHQCFSLSSSGPPGGLPRVCIRQQPIPFREEIGIEADVFQLDTKSLYIEYVQGGWLGIGTSVGLVRKYQWDDSMVPVLRLRYFADGIFTEISSLGDGLRLEEMVSIAEGSE